ncbi:serine protease [Nonomuraea sp. NPDC046570]|uniref:S1 family peptidase n=1 Tax=Nonomuraea sp. NPDC046570 TaxID=3155255 RepID=UPI0033C62514
MLVILMAIGLALTTAAAFPRAASASPGHPAIIGGRVATESYPFMVSFQFGKDPGDHCGGALIAQDWAVTAAHCEDLMKPGKTKVRVGSPDRAKGGVLAGVKRVVTHPAWGDRNSDLVGDITLVQLDRKVDLEPIRIADGPGPVGEPSRIIGWGLACEDDRNPACTNDAGPLRELDTVRVPDNRCVGLVGGAEVCSGERSGRAASACNGDSGGPQLRSVNGRWELIGVTSRDGDDMEPREDGSAGCSTGPDGKPGVGIWTDVTHYRTWIDKTIAAHSAS